MCQSCGYCKYARLDISVVCRPLPGVQSINSDAERSNVCLILSCIIIFYIYYHLYLYLHALLFRLSIPCLDYWLKWKSLERNSIWEERCVSRCGSTIDHWLLSKFTWKIQKSVKVSCLRYHQFLLNKYFLFFHSFTFEPFYSIRYSEFFKL